MREAREQQNKPVPSRRKTFLRKCRLKGDVTNPWQTPCSPLAYARHGAATPAGRLWSTHFTCGFISSCFSACNRLAPRPGGDAHSIGVFAQEMRARLLLARCAMRPHKPNEGPHRLRLEAVGTPRQRSPMLKRRIEGKKPHPLEGAVMLQADDGAATLARENRRVVDAIVVSVPVHLLRMFPRPLHELPLYGRVTLYGHDPARREVPRPDDVLARHRHPHRDEGTPALNGPIGRRSSASSSNGSRSSATSIVPPVIPSRKSAFEPLRSAKRTLGYSS